MVEKKGERFCREGSTISSSMECRNACNALNKGFGYLKHRRLCYVAGNGRCKQDGRHGSKASLICQGN